MSGDVARLFDAMADSYDELEPWYEHLYEVLHQRLRAELQPPPDGRRRRALDAGCGTGYQTVLLAELGYETHGLDLSPGLLAMARRRLASTALVLGDIQALPYPDAAFDVVTCCGSTLSFTVAPGGALLELGRVLRPGGVLLLECEHKWSLDLVWALVSSLTGDALGYGLTPRQVWHQLARPLREGFPLPYPLAMDGGATGYMTLRLFTMAELTAMLRAAGLARGRVFGIHAVTNLIPSTLLHRPRPPRLVGPLFRRLRRIDAALTAFPPARALANSVVVVAVKDGAPAA